MRERGPTNFSLLLGGQGARCEQLRQTEVGPTFSEESFMSLARRPEK